MEVPVPLCPGCFPPCPFLGARGARAAGAWAPPERTIWEPKQATPPPAGGLPPKELIARPRPDARAPPPRSPRRTRRGSFWGCTPHPERKRHVGGWAAEDSTRRPRTCRGDNPRRPPRREVWARTGDTAKLWLFFSRRARRDGGMVLWLINHHELMSKLGVIYQSLLRWASGGYG